jgi:hypothetical protein
MKIRSDVFKQILFPSFGCKSRYLSSGRVRGVLLFLLFVSFSLQGASKYRSAIEIISGKGKQVPAKELKQFCKANQLDTNAIYQWNNHVVLYAYFDQVDKVKGLIKSHFPSVKIKLYKRPFYVFDRKNCHPNDIAPQWTHVIMTANLVKDTVKQKEYMEYHRTQFEKWPEISKGFCNADFQQLLVFRNGRQLMLIISIPKGKKLDDLNPKTTENNPRVDDWNAIMSKYQEGIEDAPKGATWVMFSPLNSSPLNPPQGDL